MADLPDPTCVSDPSSPANPVDPRDTIDSDFLCPLLPSSDDTAACIGWWFAHAAAPAPRGGSLGLDAADRWPRALGGWSPGPAACGLNLSACPPLACLGVLGCRVWDVVDGSL